MCSSKPPLYLPANDTINGAAASAAERFMASPPEPAAAAAAAALTTVASASSAAGRKGPQACFAAATAFPAVSRAVDCLHEAVVRIHGHDSLQRLQQRACAGGKVLVQLPTAGERVRKVHLQGTAGMSVLLRY